jgi:Site-specific recombinases, DNA invertase Pin homologs
MGKIYGYIRMLAKEQDVDNQIITLREIQVKDRDIFIDSFVDNKRSGSNDRTQYEKLFKKLKDKDLLYIQSLNMLGDGYEEIGRQWRMLTKEKKADVAVLDMPQLDTRRGRGQFGTLVGDVVLTMLEYASDAEWMARKQKQSAGIERAKSRGVQFGRPELPWTDEFDQAYQMWKRKEIKGGEAAQLCHISRALFYKRAGKVRELELSKSDMGERSL